ncbi:MAG TPA: hypothetical protein HA283_00265 [Nanoarchaeota archaeon]|nr:hypothetical protein [Nanoarchaeota archaeon]
MNFLLFVIGIVLLLSFVSAIPQTFSIHGKLENNAGSPLEGTYSKIYKSSLHIFNNMFPVIFLGHWMTFHSSKFLEILK